MNESTNSNSTTTYFDNTSKIVWNRNTTGQILTILVLVPIFSCDLITFIILQKTKRIPFATKWLTSLTLLFDCSYQLVIILVPMMSYIVGENEFLTLVFSEIGRSALALSWATVTLMILERCICLHWPNYYARNASTWRVRFTTTVCLLGVFVIKLANRILILPYMNSEEITVVNISKDRPILTWILAVSLLIGVVCYIGLCLIVRKQIRAIDVRHSSGSRGLLGTYRATKTVWIIFFVFFAVHLPLLILLIYNHITHRGKDYRFHIFICSIVMCCVNPVMYAWRFKECRYIVVALLAKRFQFWEQRVQVMKCEVYNIVTLDSSRQETFMRQS